MNLVVFNSIQVNVRCVVFLFVFLLHILSFLESSHFVTIATVSSLLAYLSPAELSLGKLRLNVLAVDSYSLNMSNSSLEKEYDGFPLVLINVIIQCAISIHALSSSLQVFGGLVWILVASTHVAPPNPLGWVMFVSVFCFVMTFLWMIIFAAGGHKNSSHWAAAVRETQESDGE